MTLHWTAAALHEELANFYHNYRGVTAPTNGLTQSLWNKIEEVEAEEKRVRAARKHKAVK